jgi:DNA-binding transcriptional LysR family regulator
MDLELLRTFLEVNRTRHFARSAELLNITQAAVSNRVKTLETFLKVRLFDRTTRDIRLTPEGARLVRHADRVIAAWRAIPISPSSQNRNRRKCFHESWSTVTSTSLSCWSQPSWIFCK